MIADGSKTQLNWNPEMENVVSQLNFLVNSHAQNSFLDGIFCN